MALSFIPNEEVERIKREAKIAAQNARMRRKNEIIARGQQLAAKKHPVKVIKSQGNRNNGYEKYSGVQAFGDSGREFRKEDWNDGIARNFRKELRKARSFRKRMGWDGVDRGALK